MRIVVLTARAVSSPDSIWPVCRTLLQTWGAEVELIQPTAHSRVSLHGADLCLLRTVDERVLDLASVVEESGVPCLNTVTVARLCQDRERVAEMLAAAGVPILDPRLRWSEVSTDGKLHKTYRIGEQVFAVTRPWPIQGVAHIPPEPHTVSSEAQDVVDGVAAVLASDLFGVDHIQTATGSRVVAVHSFPGFKGVPDAALRLADYFYAAAMDTGADS